MIAYGPQEIIGKDGDNCLIIACLSTHHCSMIAEYSWLLNGTPIKKGRKSCILYVTQPGVYQCTVKVNENTETTKPINIIIETDEIEQNNEIQKPGKFAV